jgi:purine-cytosine permease-like protein
MTASPSPDELRKCHAYWRRVYDRLWLGVIAALAIGGTIVWAFTRNIEHFHSGLFLAIFPFVGLLNNHFFLYNPRRDPLKTQQRLVDLAEKQQRNVRTVSLVNGTILLIASPLGIVIGVAAGSEYGMAGAVVGGIIGSVWLTAGLLLIAYWRRLRRRERGHP